MTTNRPHLDAISLALLWLLTAGVKKSALPIPFRAPFAPLKHAFPTSAPCPAAVAEAQGPQCRFSDTTATETLQQSLADHFVQYERPKRKPH